MTLLLSEIEVDADAGARHAERRRGLRIRQSRPIKVFETAAAKYYGGQTEDVSVTGLRIELPASAPLAEGEILNIHVGRTHAGQSLANRRQMMPARVVWIDRHDSLRTGKLTAGVEFIATISAQLHAA
jgi:hypothetical protein